MKNNVLRNWLFIAVVTIPGFVVMAQGRANPFPEKPDATITNDEDLKQMMWQMGFTPDLLPNKATHYNAVILPKLKAFGSDVTYRPNVDTLPEANWTWATGSTSTWKHADGTGDNLTGRATVTRMPDGFWNNYIQAWEPGGAYLTGEMFYRPLALHDFSGLTVAGWPERRVQMMKAVEEIYGRIPAKASELNVSWTIDSVREVTKSWPMYDWSCRCMTKGGEALANPFREYAITGTVTNPSGYVAREMPKITGTLRTPVKLSKGKKIPVIIIFGSDESLWNTMAPADIAVFNFNNNALQPDRGGQAMSSFLIGLVNEGNWRKPYDWGSLVAWSWGVSRFIDFLESPDNTIPIDTRYIGLTGHSRYGKATLVTMAYEKRIAFSFPSSSGALGVAQSRRHLGQDMDNVATASSEYHWVAGTLLKYVGLHPESKDGYMPRKVMDMPADAETLVALCAPRPIFIASGRPEEGESWADPYGMYLTAVAASPAYELLGKKGVVMNDFMDYKGRSIPMPEINRDYIEGDIGYRNHGGGHIAAPNYPAFLSFIRKYMPKGKK